MPDVSPKRPSNGLDDDETTTPTREMLAASLRRWRSLLTDNRPRRRLQPASAWSSSNDTNDSPVEARAKTSSASANALAYAGSTETRRATRQKLVDVRPCTTIGRVPCWGRRLRVGLRGLVLRRSGLGQHHQPLRLIEQSTIDLKQRQHLCVLRFGLRHLQEAEVPRTLGGDVGFALVLLVGLDRLALRVRVRRARLSQRRPPSEQLRCGHHLLGQHRFLTLLEPPKHGNTNISSARRNFAPA